MSDRLTLADHLAVLAESGASVTAFCLANTAATPLQVWLEPWGDMQVLEPGAHFDVVASASEAISTHLVQLDWSDEHVVLWAQTDTSDLRLFADGVEVWVNGLPR